MKESEKSTINGYLDIKIKVVADKICETLNTTKKFKETTPSSDLSHELKLKLFEHIPLEIKLSYSFTSDYNVEKYIHVVVSYSGHSIHERKFMLDFEDQISYNEAKHYIEIESNNLMDFVEEVLC